MALHMTLGELLKKIPCGLVIAPNNYDAYPAYEFCAIVYGMAKDRDGAINALIGQYQALTMVPSVEELGIGQVPFFQVHIADTVMDFSVYGHQVFDAWNEIIKSDWKCSDCPGW